ncbi:Protein-disulfide isomerase [Mycobacterium numidiamassiliense]|uniref:Protein-disulfide isomerase n=1 Tax=Mycobacterium numidiamassiliense TaxID=1841861 RepID=A0A2U3PE83_9MYCO|nr:DsbA family protein [Mycobacterium numidiamassiliense]SPM42061.1 Protein-disulfide isomerase [Mycobacterium numidiamassiliense]
MTTAVDFHFDPMCPFAFQTSVWMRDVRAQLGIDINWRFFSLEEINREDGKKHPWERDWSYGWSLMRIGALLRRTDMALLDRWYEAIGHELHVAGGKPHDPVVARRLLVGIGVDGSILDAALDDSTTHDEVRADHQRVVDAGGYGVPTLFFDGQCLFGPVLVDPPTGPASVKLWDVVSGMASLPHVYELQRPKSAADAELIGRSLRPYLDGRDWVSINRGEVIDVEGLTGGRG